MKVVVQRVENAEVKVNDEITGKISNGFLLLVGFTYGDDEKIVNKMAEKVTKLRVFEDAAGKINLDLRSVYGSILSVSQFTLYATLNGNRPSFDKALTYLDAQKLYKQFNLCLRNLGFVVEEGVFGGDMKVTLLNDGPVTIIIDSKECLWKKR